ncbi:MAG: precorrin-3B C(17)-methyltransferase, partial [Cyanobacteria bacterium J06641_5]
WPLHFFTAEELNQIEVPTPSEVVRNEVGTPSVAEASAIAASESELLIPKQIYRDSSGACTVAIARAEREYNPNPGHLYLIGSGPGALNQLTLAARAALTRCDAIIGYQLYLDLLQPLFHPQQLILGSPIGQEVRRAERAIALAKRGLTVGVVSSGDCGIYGMAGLVLECLAKQGWDGQTPGVEVLPGISALQATAARIGAPLMHDFCAISLSDLLVPWELIERRLEAAARADFATALYNPRSRQRQRGIEIALEIFRRERSPTTTVAIAKSVYRPEEEIRILTLGEVDPTTIDMLSVVLIGNTKTFVHAGRAIAPRGYLSKVESNV